MTNIADRYAALKYQAEAIETELKALRAAILATGQEVVEGEQCSVTVALSERVTLDTKLAAFACYGSQTRPAGHPRAIEQIRRNDEALGGRIGVRAAEAFVPYRILL